MAKQGAKTVTPALRFPQFKSAAEWATKELRQLSGFVTEKVGDSDCVPYTVTSGIGLISQEEKLGRTIAGNSLKNYIVLEKDDFAYNKSATKAFPQGFIARYVGDERAAVPNSIFTCFRADRELVDPVYLENLFSTNLHGNWLRSRIAVGARAHGSLNVSDDDLMDVPVPLPGGASSLVEQQKIADCLTSLDEVIAAQGRKVEALKAHKRGLMRQLFPREGEAAPRLRFSEFRNAPEWKRKSLKRLANEFLDGDWIESKDQSATGIRLVQTGNVGAGEFLAKDANARYVSEDTFRRLRCTEIFPGDCLISRLPDPIGRACLLPNGLGRTITAVDCTIARFDETQIIPSLFVSYSQTEEYSRAVSSLSSGSTRARISRGALEALEVPVSNIAEQQRIADCLNPLDTQITTESNQLAALKTHKQGLMQQLFPAPQAMRA